MTQPITMQRSGGLLLHPTSLPGPFGIGDLGPAATDWLDFLARTNTGVWQILPLGPTGYGDSPYQCFSSFAGNPLLVSPEHLLADGLVPKSALARYPSLPDDHVDFAGVFAAKAALLSEAFERFRGKGGQRLGGRFDQFVADTAPWLDEFCLYMALKQVNGGRSWTTWDEDLRQRDPTSLAVARKRLAPEMLRHAFHQFVFFEQWRAVRRQAAAAGVTIVGDLPFYVAEDSADVWSRQDLFQLDAAGRPTVVAGVPPDYFAETGQLWGNPIYRWSAHEAEAFTWWTDRICAAAAMTDVVRIDHFRAFADYWEIPSSAPTAETGQWVDGPGREIFDLVAARSGGLPFVVEDLGDLSAKVDVLRNELDLPGMKILQFAFDSGPTDPFLPHHYPERCAAYTGTHDNDPVNAWWEGASLEEMEYAGDYLQWDGVDPAGRFVSTLWESRAQWAITQMQDLLRLGAEARMNTPGTPAGNWTWRMASGSAEDQVVDLLALNERCDRARPGVPS